MEFKNVKSNEEAMTADELRIQQDPASRAENIVVRDINREFQEKFQQRLDEWQPDERLWIETQGEFVSGQNPYRRLHAKKDDK